MYCTECTHFCSDACRCKTTSNGIPQRLPEHSDYTIHYTICQVNDHSICLNVILFALYNFYYLSNQARARGASAERIDRMDRIFRMPGLLQDWHAEGGAVSVWQAAGMNGMVGSERRGNAV